MTEVRRWDKEDAFKSQIHQLTEAVEEAIETIKEYCWISINGQEVCADCGTDEGEKHADHCCIGKK